ncbi:MAG: pilus assembly protein PilM [Planctomycetota bacterium]
MALHRTALGLDIGTRYVRVVELRVSGAGGGVERSLVIPREELDVGTGEDTDLPLLASRLAEALKENGWKSKHMVVGLDASMSMLRYTHVPPMQPARLNTVVGFEVESIADRMEEPLASDFAVLPVRRDDGDRTVLMGLAREEPLSELVSALTAAKINTDGGVPGAVALYSAWQLFAEKEDQDAAEDDLVVAVDMGASNLHVAVILNDRLVFARSSSFGGDNFTDALASGLRLDRDDAEKLKVAYGGIDESLRGVRKETVGPLRSVAGQLLSTVQSTLRFCGSQADVLLPSPTRVWVTGGGMRLRGLSEYLERSLSANKVEAFDPAGGKGEEVGAGASLGLAIGLAAWGLRSNQELSVDVNVLPSEFRKKKTFRERTVFSYAAIACLVLFLGARLTQAMLTRMDASANLAVLEKNLTELEAKRAERDEKAARSVEIRARVNRMLEESEVPAFQGYILNLLSEVLRPEFRLDSVILQADERKTDDGFDYSFELKGRVSDERNKGLDWILELKEALANEERLREVQIVGSKADGPWYTFHLALWPNTQRI